MKLTIVDIEIGHAMINQVQRNSEVNVRIIFGIGKQAKMNKDQDQGNRSPYACGDVRSRPDWFSFSKSEHGFDNDPGQERQHPFYRPSIFIRFQP
jgi:hypothetical protein